MKIFISALLIITTTGTAAQFPDSCSCKYQLSYPPKAADSGISGIVIIEMDVNEKGMLSNPKVIKGIGYGCDEEAMRINRIFIACNNRSSLRRTPGVKRKIRQTVTFLPNEEITENPEYQTALKRILNQY